ncbi:MAG: hypothetical protein JST79_10445 [Acidobacteria bacterium]|nr:hypothetical protein [Acidobacteriota bacterium]
MSNAALRAAMTPVARRVRAFFAPVDRATESPTIFDPGKAGAFLLATPPAPWLDLGWIDDFQRTATTGTEQLRSGATGAPVGQFRSTLEGRVQFRFREWGKLQMALASGSEHMNVLASDPNADAQPSGGTPVPAAAVLPGSSGSEVMIGAGAVDDFSAGDMIAVDADYAQQTGYVGSGIAAAYVANSADVLHDLHYIRRVTFNVARIAERTAISLVLAQPLPGGPPLPGWGVQKLVAFVDREGGSFFPHWSGLFVAEEESGGRVCFYYPRLSPASAAQPGALQPGEEFVPAGKLASLLALRASFVALPHVDGNDGKTVVCYRSYFPAAAAALY